MSWRDHDDHGLPLRGALYALLLLFGVLGALAAASITWTSWERPPAPAVVRQVASAEEECERLGYERPPSPPGARP